MTYSLFLFLYFFLRGGGGAAANVVMLNSEFGIANNDIMVKYDRVVESSHENK